MAISMLAKLSFKRIKSEDSLATSVQAIHIAIHMSAFFKAGASLTQSHVTATFSPECCKISTIFLLLTGLILANIGIFLSNNIFLSSLSFIEITSSQFIKLKFPSSISQIFKAIAFAVSHASQVIMITFIHAFFVIAIALFTSSRGGSIIHTIQTNTIFVSVFLIL